MLVALQRLDKIAAFKSAVAERGMLTGTTFSYTARVLAGEQSQAQVAAAAAAAALDNEDDDDDDGTVHGPKSLSDIEYPKYHHLLQILIHYL
jgi:hypothetical protein